MPAKLVHVALLGVALAATARPVAGQAPTGPPPPSSRVEDGGAPGPELLPALGRIGAQAGLMAGFSRNPYGVGGGVQAAGHLDVPLARAAGGKLSYQILIALSHAKSDPLVITDPLAYVANLATGASPAAALAGPPGAPFPVRRSVRTRLRLLEVSPFGLKYTLTALDHARVRPYVAAGADIVVVITKQVPLQKDSLIFTGTSPFDAALIGGLVAQAPELEALGVPTGQGNIEAGFHAGGGIELRLSRGVSLNLDYRFTGVGGTASRLHALSSGLGIHW
jgi:hypothetical protein